MQPVSDERPTHPKLRPVEPKWVDHQSQRYLYLHDTYGFAENGVLVPEALIPLLGLCDGSRDLGQLRVGLSLRTGIQLSPSQVEELVGQLDRAMLLENGAYRKSAERALSEYRAAPYRGLHHADAVYPSRADALASAIAGFVQRVPDESRAGAPAGRLVGMVSPHIDYERGGVAYAQLWQKAKPHLEDIDLVLMFGTDHSGGLGALTPTRQSYSTPLGVLPTDSEIVDGLVEVLGPDQAYEEELHHLKEHSIELAAVWMHHYMGGRSCPMVPVLCGSFHHFVADGKDPLEDVRLTAAVEYLAEATAGRRVLAVAAGDLAHVGPAFGDALPVDLPRRGRLRDNDAESISAICDGDATRFFELSRVEGDARKICGLPPIYMMLRYLGRVKGESVGYDQCPADSEGGSFVSIVGVLLHEQ